GVDDAGVGIARVRGEARAAVRPQEGGELRAGADGRPDGTHAHLRRPRGGGIEPLDRDPFPAPENEPPGADRPLRPPSPSPPPPPPPPPPPAPPAGRQRPAPPATGRPCPCSAPPSPAGPSALHAGQGDALDEGLLGDEEQDDDRDDGGD